MASFGCYNLTKLFLVQYIDLCKKYLRTIVVNLSSVSNHQPCCSTNSVDVGVSILWTVKLYNPVNCRKIEPSCSNICGKQHSKLLTTEWFIDSHSLHLLHGTMQWQNCHSWFHPSEYFIDKPHLKRMTYFSKILGHHCDDVILQPKIININLLI